MLRRGLAFLLLAAGGVLLIYVLRHRPGDVRQATALIGLVAGGMLINAVALGRRHLPLRGLVRNLACLVGLILLAGTLAMWHWLGGQTAEPSPDRVVEVRPDPALRAALLQWQGVLLWVSVAVGYVTAALALLPRPARRPAPAQNDEG